MKKTTMQAAVAAGMMLTGCNGGSGSTFQGWKIVSAFIPPG